METEHAIWCDECEEWECVHCHGMNAATPAEVDEHASTCPDNPAYLDTLADERVRDGVIVLDNRPALVGEGGT